MKRKAIAVTVLAASLSVAAGLTSYAGWVQDSYGWGYQRADGSWVGCGWFTDPEDGSQYYMDPDGYMMSETRVEGFWLGADGRKQEKSQAEIQAEAERAARVAARPSPNKEVAAIEGSADSAKKAVAATSTFRKHYQAEMKTHMDRIFLSMAEKLYADAEERTAAALEAAKQAALEASMNSEDGDSVGDLSVDLSNLYPTDTRANDDNLKTYYSIFKKDGAQDIISGSFSKNRNKDSRLYVPYAMELTYARDNANNAEETVVFDEGYRQLLIAAIGESAGQAIYDKSMSGELADGTLGDADNGNTYSVAVKNGKITVQVTCSEVAPAAEENVAE